MSFEQVEEAWGLIDKARAFAKEKGADPSLEEYWSALFAGEAQVDTERSIAEGGQSITRIFLRSPYGLIWRPEHKDWIPFRHGEVVLPPLDLD
jgi:hypothetical protein